MRQPGVPAQRARPSNQGEGLGKQGPALAQVQPVQRHQRKTAGCGLSRHARRRVADTSGVKPAAFAAAIGLAFNKSSQQGPAGGRGGKSISQVLVQQVGPAVAEDRLRVGKALVDSGLLKVQSFRKSQNKLAYAYLLTPSGIAEKSAITGRFLKRKMAEYEHLQAEIAAPQIEVSG